MPRIFGKMIHFLKWVNPEPFMGSMDNTWFSHYQTKTWRPGLISHKTKKLEDHMESYKTQRISWRMIWTNLPYLEETSTYSAIDLQQLFYLIFGVKETYCTTGHTPRLHYYLPKLSRIKPTEESLASSLIPPDLLILAPTASLFNSRISFLFLSF